MTNTPDAKRSRSPCRQSLLNRSVARRFILAALSKARPHLGITRVSGQALDTLEGWLREKIRSEVHSHPSVGKTFKL